MLANETQTLAPALDSLTAMRPASLFHCSPKSLEESHQTPPCLYNTCSGSGNLPDNKAQQPGRTYENWQSTVGSKPRPLVSFGVMAVAPCTTIFDVAAAIGGRPLVRIAQFVAVSAWSVVHYSQFTLRMVTNGCHGRYSSLTCSRSWVPASASAKVGLFSRCS
jgi:hypothetical protein